jgi:hypothetical protein
LNYKNTKRECADTAAEVNKESRTHES